MAVLYTIGHSNRSAREIVEALASFGVTRLLDVRRFPASRSQPQFNGPAFAKVLRRAGISYLHMEELGGRRSKSRRAAERRNAGWEHQAFHNYADYAETPPFQRALKELLAMARQETCAILCAEALWWRCHRRIIADYVMARGVEVVHIFPDGKGQPAFMTPFAVVRDKGRIQYRPPGS
jgi:uncharacterized protein (DUF488 family)